MSTVRHGQGASAKLSAGRGRCPRAGVTRVAVRVWALGWLPLLLLASCSSSEEQSGRGRVDGPDGQPDLGSLADAGGVDVAGDTDPLGQTDMGNVDGGGEWPGLPPARPALLPLDGQLLFPVTIDGRTQPSYLVVDTGAVRSALQEELLRELRNGVGRATIDFGHGVVLDDYEVLAADLSEAVDHIGVRLDGLIGQDIFLGHWLGLDYRRVTVSISASLPEAPLPGCRQDQVITVPYALEQMLPVVEVEIGGRTARLIADTGSGVTVLTESFVEADVLAQGLDGYVWYTSYGSDPGRIVRLPELELSGYPVAGSWAVIIPDDFHLRRVFEMLGVHVDGFLGYPVYRRFYVAVVGTESRYELCPDPAGDPVGSEEWDRVGIEVKRSEGEVTVDMVFSPSSAADQGIVAGERLLAIDGQDIAGMGPDDVRRLLRGTPGSTRQLDLARPGEGARLVTVQVDRLLPLP